MIVCSDLQKPSIRRMTKSIDLNYEIFIVHSKDNPVPALMQGLHPNYAVQKNWIQRIQCRNRYKANYSEKFILKKDLEFGEYMQADVKEYDSSACEDLQNTREYDGDKDKNVTNNQARVQNRTP